MGGDALKNQGESAGVQNGAVAGVSVVQRSVRVDLETDAYALSRCTSLKSAGRGAKR